MSDFTIQTRGAAELARAFDQAPALVARETQTAMGVAMRLVHAAVAERTPVRTGALERSLAIDIVGAGTSLRGVIASPLAYAPYVEFGTRPHEISARAAGVLRFVVSGHVVYARHAQHPGTPGAHMFERGLAAATPDVEVAFADAAQRVVSTLAAAGVA